ncbi:MAG: ShlB/FhaC/HecB family hemolysin secretion/activation protein, partial [Leptolyngbyaceae cyanobacterium MAG.088]|nr:ShlB/FhaC/HecB family hemolysin secretion/activation protein [Leptolyngbyaceae cyanobacterium MAG.088]
MLAQTRYAQSEFPDQIEIETLPALPDNQPEPLLEASPTEVAPPALIRPGTIPETIVVNDFDVVGSTVLNEVDLAEITAPYLNRPLTPADLFEVRSAITQRYVEAGYVNSGAYIPPQTLNNGVVKIQVLEGRLTDINVDVDGRLSPGYVRRRLALAGETPLNSERLLDGLRLLQLDPLIETVTAELATGTEPGTSVLDVD